MEKKSSHYDSEFELNEKFPPTSNTESIPLVLYLSQTHHWAQKTCAHRYIIQDCRSGMIHKIKYFEAAKLQSGVFLEDVVNDFLAEKGEKIIAVHPVMEKTLLVHYTDDF